MKPLKKSLVQDGLHLLHINCTLSGKGTRLFRNAGNASAASTSLIVEYVTLPLGTLYSLTTLQHVGSPSMMLIIRKLTDDTSIVVNVVVFFVTDAHPIKYYWTPLTSSMIPRYLVALLQPPHSVFAKGVTTRSTRMSQVGYTTVVARLSSGWSSIKNDSRFLAGSREDSLVRS